MVNIGRPYDANQHEPNATFDPITPGWYAMQIIKSEVAKTKDGQGQFLKLTFEMIEAAHPDLKGRQCWDRLNLWNRSQQAVDIANGTLSAICRAIGQMAPWEDTTVLHSRPLAVKLKIRPADGNYDASNDISGYDAVASRFQTGAPVSQGTMSPPQQPVAQPPQQAQAAPPPQTSPQQAAAAPPQQGQPGETDAPPWQRKP